MALSDFAAHLNGQCVHVVYHGGCPDGCLSAVIMRTSIAHYYTPKSLEVIPTSHADRNAESITEGSTAIFVDVSPTLEDEPRLQTCRCVIILDHHGSATADQKALQVALSHISNYSDISGDECGASLAQRFCCSSSVPAVVLHVFHRLNVFQHELPEECAHLFDAFQGFINQPTLLVEGTVLLSLSRNLVNA